MNTTPRGCIHIWNLDTGAIPRGWQLCDGSAGTPDLRYAPKYDFPFDLDQLSPDDKEKVLKWVYIMNMVAEE
jgi:hypothetical protein